MPSRKKELAGQVAPDYFLSACASRRRELSGMSRRSPVRCPSAGGRLADLNRGLVAGNQRLVQENAKLMEQLRRAEAIRDIKKTFPRSLGSNCNQTTT